ncbi:hypothetical protein Bca4012_090919 [Brassica carinata]
MASSTVLNVAGALLSGDFRLPSLSSQRLRKSSSSTSMFRLSNGDLSAPYTCSWRLSRDKALTNSKSFAVGREAEDGFLSLHCFGLKSKDIQLKIGTLWLFGFKVSTFKTFRIATSDGFLLVSLYRFESREIQVKIGTLCLFGFKVSTFKTFRIATSDGFLLVSLYRFESRDIQNVSEDSDEMFDDLFNKYGKVVYKSDDLKSPTAEVDDDAESLAFAVEMAKVASEVKAGDIKVLFVKPLVYWTRFFIIATAFSRPQIDAIGSRMRDMAEKKYGKVANGDVKPNAWTLLDFGDVVIHLFLPPQRTFYNLEDFYGNAMSVPLPFEDEAPPRS